MNRIKSFIYGILPYLVIGSFGFLLFYGMYYSAVVAPGHEAVYKNLPGQGEFVCVEKWDKNHIHVQEQCQKWSWEVDKP